MPITRLPLALALGILVLLIAALVRSTTGAAADMTCDRFVSPSGSDSGSGSISSPYRTPEKLVNSLASGQTGCFRGGTYRFAELDVTQANITLAPYHHRAVTLRGSIKVKPSGHDSVIK